MDPNVPLANGHAGDFPPGNGESSLIFLGTGCSSAVPNAMCLLQPSDPPCDVCTRSLMLPPEKNRDYRCNTSLLIDFFHGNGEHSYILIDSGKTFREQVLRWFTHHKIPRVDSIILTHEHADAILGLDDIRTVQPFSPVNDITPTPVYLTEFAMDRCIPRNRVKEDLKLMKSRKFIGSDDIPIEAWEILGEVMHGEDYLSLGFLFGERSRIAYISDVSRFPQSTEYVISNSGAGRLDLLILDTLYKNGSHNTHLCFAQTLYAVKRICPKRALLIGMTHEFDHDEDNEWLAEWSRRL